MEDPDYVEPVHTPGHDAAKNIILFAMNRFQKNYCYLDENNILWRFVDGVFTGYPAVQTVDLRHVWVQDLELENKLITNGKEEENSKQESNPEDKKSHQE